MCFIIPQGMSFIHLPEASKIIWNSLVGRTHKILQRHEGFYLLYWHGICFLDSVSYLFCKCEVLQKQREQLLFFFGKMPLQCCPDFLHFAHKPPADPLRNTQRKIDLSHHKFQALQMITNLCRFVLKKLIGIAYVCTCINEEFLRAS